MAIIGYTEQQKAKLDDVDFYNELYGGRVYNYDAVSGAQIRVMLGDNVIIDDATAIQFSLTQSKKPIYGYHSRYFDTVAEGVVIVQGRIMINFIHPGYLRLLIRAAQQPDFLEKLENNATRAARNAKSGQQSYDGTPISQAALINFVKSEAERNRKFQIDQSKGLPRPDLYRNVKFTIKYANEGFFKNVPAKIIENVHFVGEGQEIQISGQPIQEMYEFIARKLS